MPRRVLATRWWLALIFACGWVPRALAQPRVVAVLPFQGPGAARVRDAVVAVLANDDRVALVSSASLLRAERARHASLASAAGRAAVADALAIGSFIAGQVRRRGGINELELRIYQGVDGEAIGRKVVRARRAVFARVVRARLSAELGRHREDEPSAEPAQAHDAAAAPVAAAELAPQAAPASARQPASEVDRAQVEPAEPSAEPDAIAAFEPARARATVELDALLELATRDYAYVDAQGKLPEHTTGATPGARVHVRWYPAASLGTDVAAAFGLDAYAASMLPIDTAESASVYPTHSYAYGLGLHARAPFGEHALGALIGYGHHGFDIANSALGEAAAVPSVSYDFVRFGGELRLALNDALALDARGAYLWLQGFGELAAREWFPHTTGGAIEAELALRYALSSTLELRAGAGLERYFMSLHPRPDDPGVVVQRRVAGGAVDQLVRVSLALALRL